MLFMRVLVAVGVRWCALVSTAWKAISILFGINRVRNRWSYLVGPPFLAFTACFSAMPGSHFPRALIESLVIIGGCG